MEGITYLLEWKYLHTFITKNVMNVNPLNENLEFVCVCLPVENVKDFTAT